MAAQLIVKYPELLHKGDDRPLSISVCELEAESVAFEVVRHFGLDNLASPNYITLHGAKSKVILDHMDRIRATAAEIISAVQADGRASE